MIAGGAQAAKLRRVAATNSAGRVRRAERTKAAWAAGDRVRSPQLRLSTEARFAAARRRRRHAATRNENADQNGVGQAAWLA